MEVLFHFLFELVKIAILAAIYAALITLLLGALGKYKPGSWFDRIAKKKMRLWFMSGLTISCVLFVFMFSYWGNHGLGDSAKIPIGNGKTVDQINGMTFITPAGYEMETLDIHEFTTTDGFLFAKISSNRPAAVNKEIAIWNLKTNQVEFLDHYSDLEILKTKNNMQAELTFQDFQGHYSKYWNGWRFWLLP